MTSLEPGDWAHVYILRPSLADPAYAEMWYRTLQEALDVVDEHDPAPEPGYVCNCDWECDCQEIARAAVTVTVTRKTVSFTKLSEVFETDVLVGFTKAPRPVAGGDQVAIDLADREESKGGPDGD